MKDAAAAPETPPIAEASDGAGSRFAPPKLLLAARRNVLPRSTPSRTCSECGAASITSARSGRIFVHDVGSGSSFPFTRWIRNGARAAASDSHGPRCKSSRATSMVQPRKQLTSPAFDSAAAQGPLQVLSCSVNTSKKPAFTACSERCLHPSEDADVLQINVQSARTNARCRAQSCAGAVRHKRTRLVMIPVCTHHSSMRWDNQELLYNQHKRSTPL
mmetsp:Transcript_87256/g.244891  ORF Transcript_87256/g.244891 Transcript_87256/m.244891 type:complete len:217 (+) Transcript_87256:557-1207(+)